MSFSYATVDDPYWLLAGPAVWLGYLLGYYIDPDLDQANITSAEWRIMRDLHILGSIIVAWFMPYGRLMKHRSFMSHFPVVSTSIRYAWLLAFPLFSVPMWYTTPGILPSYWPVLLGIFLGLSIADGIHYTADRGIIRVRRGRR